MLFYEVYLNARFALLGEPLLANARMAAPPKGTKRSYSQYNHDFNPCRFLTWICCAAAFACTVLGSI